MNGNGFGSGMRSRKFIAFVVMTLIFTAVVILSLVLHPEFVTATMVLGFGGLIFLAGAAYIGGNVWSDVAHSKYVESSRKL